MNLSKKDLDSLKTIFTNKPVKRAFLFGSYARGEGMEESDVDILVELNYAEHIGLGFISMKFEIEEALDKKVDLISENALPKDLLPFVNADKKLIYEK